MTGIRSIWVRWNQREWRPLIRALVFKVTLDTNTLKNNSISWKFVTLWHANSHRTTTLIIGSYKTSALHRTKKYKKQSNTNCSFVILHAQILYIHALCTLLINSPWNNRIQLNMQLLSHEFMCIAHHTYTSSSPASFSCCKSLNRTLNSFCSHRQPIDTTKNVSLLLLHSKGIWWVRFFLVPLMQKPSNENRIDSNELKLNQKKKKTLQIRYENILQMRE